MAEVDDCLRQVGRLLDAAAEETSAARRARREERTELGFSVPVAEDKVDALEGQLRGNYDASVMRRDHPKLCRLVAWAVAQGAKWDTVARVTGLSWETIRAIAGAEEVSIREFKSRSVRMLQGLIAAGNGVILRKIEQGDLTVFDLKLLHELVALLSGDATSRVEHRAAPAEDAEELRWRRAYESARDVTPVPGALGMGSEGGEFSALAAAVAGSLREAEEARPGAESAQVVVDDHMIKDSQ